MRIIQKKLINAVLMQIVLLNKTIFYILQSIIHKLIKTESVTNLKLSETFNKKNANKCTKCTKKTKKRLKIIQFPENVK